MLLTKPLELEIWQGDWGMPSVDIHCLQALALVNISGVPVKVKVTNNPFFTPNGRLPVLRTNSSSLDTIKDMLDFFKQRDLTADSSIKVLDYTDIMAYDTMLKEKLYPAIQFVCWLDQKNFNELIRPWYSKALPFPLNFYYPWQYEKHARNMMKVLYPMEDDMTVIENKVYSEAQKCITLLSTRLGDSQFFFGSHPTIIDAIIYGYLQPLLKIPFPNATLQNHLKACTNLSQFTLRITRLYFGDEYQAYEKIRAEKNAQKMSADSTKEFPNKRRNQFLAGLVVTLAMAGYALSTGILQVPTKKENEVDMLMNYVIDDDDAET